MSHTYVSPQLDLMQCLGQRTLEITCLINKDQITLTCTRKKKQMLLNAEPVALGTPFPECGQYMCDGKENPPCSSFKFKPL